LESIEARLSLIDKILAHPLGFTRRPITLRNHILIQLCKLIFLTGGAYAPYATGMAMPLRSVSPAGGLAPQQMRVASCCEPTDEAQHGLVSTGMGG